MPSRWVCKYCSGTSCDPFTFLFPKSKNVKQKWEKERKAEVGNVGEKNLLFLETSS